MVIQELLMQWKNKGIIIRLNETGDLSVTAPKGVMTSEIAQQIRDNKQEIISFLGVGEIKSTSSSLPPIKPIVSKNPFVPLSLAQERLWLLAQLLPDTPIYNIPYAFRLHGSLDIDAFVTSLKWVVARHEALRIHFELIDEQPQTVIADNLTIDFQIVSLDHLEGTEQDVVLYNMLHEHSQRPFDLSVSPLFRVVLFKLSASEYAFLFVVHHIIFDGWSLDVFIDDLAFAYQTPEPDITRPPLSIQYSDYSVWQRDWLNSSAAKDGMEFWQSTLQEPVEALQLPISHQLSGNLSFYETQQQQIVIPQVLTTDVKLLAQRMKASPFMVLLTAYKATLFAYTGQEDMMVCSPTAGRMVASLEGLIGYFNSVVVFRSKLDENLIFNTLLAQEKQVILEANEHQTIPFQYLAELPSVSNLPLMRTMFVFQNRVKPVLGFPGIKMSPMAMQSKYGYADISIELTEKDGEITGNLWFKSSLFDGEYIEQFIENYLSILTMVTTNPERPLSALPRFDMPVVVDTGESLDDGAEKRPFTPPRDELETELASIWGHLLAYKPVSIYDDFFEVGGHSLLAIRLFEQIEKLTGEKLPLAFLFKAPTIAGLVEFIRDGESEVEISSVVTLAGQTTPAQVEQRPFYFVIPPGDELLALHDLAQAMGKKRPFIGLQYGVNNETPIMTVEAMAAYFVQQIVSQGTQEPYLLGGYCYGGLLAYEMAQQLTSQGKEVALVALIDTNVPGAVTEKKSSLREIVNNRVNNLQEAGVTTEVHYIMERTADHFKTDFWNPVLGKLQKRYAERDQVLPRSLRKFILINNQAQEQYHTIPYAGNVILFQAGEQHPAYEYPPHLGWDKVLTGKFADHTVPGEHRTILDNPHATEMATILQNVIAETLAAYNN